MVEEAGASLKPLETVRDVVFPVDTPLNSLVSTLVYSAQLKVTGLPESSNVL